MKTWNEPGRGRKHCISCGKYVASRTKECICGNSFIKVKAKVGKTQESAVPPRTKRGKYNISLIVPSGPSPISLCSFEREAVQCWSRDLARYYASRNLFMEPTVPKYLARKYVDIFSVEYTQICGYIDELYFREEMIDE